MEKFERRTKPLSLEHQRPDALLDGQVSLTDKMVATIEQRISDARPLDSRYTLNNLVCNFYDKLSINPYIAVKNMANSPLLGVLLGADVGVKEKYALHEHTQAVMAGFENDYAKEFADPTDLKIARLTLLEQDIGKPLWAKGEKHHNQTTYNLAVAENLLRTIDDDVLHPEEKTLVSLLIAEDIMGPAMKDVTVKNRDGKEISLETAKTRIEWLRAVCPKSQQKRLTRLLPIIYLADVTAYTGYREYKKAGGQQRQQCHGELDHLFQPDDWGTLNFREPYKQTMDDLRQILRDSER